MWAVPTSYVRHPSEFSQISERDIDGFLADSFCSETSTEHIVALYDPKIWPFWLPFRISWQISFQLQSEHVPEENRKNQTFDKTAHVPSRVCVLYVSVLQPALLPFNKKGLFVMLIPPSWLTAWKLLPFSVSSMFQKALSELGPRALTYLLLPTESKPCVNYGSAEGNLSMGAEHAMAELERDLKGGIVHRVFVFFFFFSLLSFCCWPCPCISPRAHFYTAAVGSVWKLLRSIES